MSRYVLALASLATLSQQAVLPRADDDGELAPLSFKKDGSFQISVFSDLHFGRNAADDGPNWDLNTVRVISSVLDYDTPDLVVLNGDLINGDSTYVENSTHYIDQIVAPMVERELTWASTYGNHDHHYNISTDDTMERERMWPGARTNKMVNTDGAGTSNYFLPVFPNDCTDIYTCTPDLLLWFFDSRGGMHFEGDYQETWVHPSVVQWFTSTSDELVKTYNKTIPSLAFVHIPINATEAIQTQLGIHQNYQPGINDDPPCPQQGEGFCADGTRDPNNCPYGGQDEPFMEALVSVPGLMGLFYGHDHGNSWCARWDSLLDGMNVEGNGLHLCFGQMSGYGGYGDWIRGGRQIVVTQEKLKDWVVDTHIRLESGDIVGAVTLNSTFNEDYYPATPNQKTYVEDHEWENIGKVYSEEDEESQGSTHILATSLRRPDDIIINTLDPGLVKQTGLHRDVPSGALGATLSILKKFTGRTREQGAAAYIDAAVLRGKETHGSFLVNWEIYPYGQFYYQPQRPEVQQRLWDEMMKEFEFAKMQDSILSMKAK